MAKKADAGPAGPARGWGAGFVLKKALVYILVHALALSPAGLSAARSAYDLAQGVMSLPAPLGDGPTGANSQAAAVSVSVSYGSSASESQSSTHDVAAQGSHLSSGGDMFIVARGDEKGQGGDLSVIGSRLSAEGQAQLAANHDLNLLSAANQSDYENSGRSSSSSFGASASIGSGGWGISVQAAASRGRGQGRGHTVTHNETVVQGGQGVEFASLNDTTLRGAQILGETVAGGVGGNLNIISERDTSVQSQSQSNQGFSVSIPVYGMGGEASFSLTNQRQNASGSYASVNEQSGIFAGQGGFGLTVGGGTDLVGAVIASAAGPSRNSLLTGSLTVSDIANQADYSANTGGLSAGMEGGRFMGAPSLPMKEGGREDSLTRSAVAEGTVVITDEAAQQARTGQTAAEMAASLNRDVQNAHQGPLALNPDLGEILAQQAEIADAAGQAGRAVAQTIGDIAKRFTKEYEEAQMAEAAAQAALADPNKSPAEKELARAVLAKAQEVLSDPKAWADYESWSEGGLNKTLLQAAGAALVAQIGNGEGLNAALGAAASQLAAGQVREFAASVTQGLSDDPGTRRLLSNLIGNAVSSAIGQAVGGETGANLASDMDRYNRQLHPAEIEWIKNHAEDFAQLVKEILGEDLTAAEATQVLALQALRTVDAWWNAVLEPGVNLTEKDEALIAAARAFLDEAGAADAFATPNWIHDGVSQGFFTAPGGQFGDPTFLADLYGGESGKPYLDFYRQYVHPGLPRNNVLYSQVMDYYGLEAKNTAEFVTTNLDLVLNGLGESLGDKAYDFTGDPLGAWIGASYAFTDWLGGLGRDVEYQFSSETRGLLDVLYNDDLAGQLRTDWTAAKAGLTLIPLARPASRAAEKIYEAASQTLKAAAGKAKATSVIYVAPDGTAVISGPSLQSQQVALKLARSASGVDSTVERWIVTQNGNGAEYASIYALNNAGVTLEQALAKGSINMPVFFNVNPKSLSAWEDASRIFANGASGNVRVSLGPNYNPLSSIYGGIESPLLLGNPNITKMIEIPFIP